MPASFLPRTFSGTVRVVDGGPIEGVSVSSHGQSTVTTVTDVSGAFTLESSGAINLVFWKSGYHWAVAWVPPTGDQGPMTVNVKLQPEVILAVNSPVSNVISPDDLTYDSNKIDSFEEGDYYCSPCKEITIYPWVQGAGVRFRVHWTGPIPLDLWVGDRYVGVTASGIGNSSDHELIVEGGASTLDTVLIGLGKRNGVPQTLNQPVAFQLSIEPAQ